MPCYDGLLPIAKSGVNRSLWITHKMPDQRSAIGRIPWDVVGIIATLAVGVYYGVAYEKKPNISYEVLAAPNVVDVNEPIPKLEVRYAGEDLIKKGLNLRLLSVRIGNKGHAAVRPQDYDTTVKWGLRVEPGTLISAQLLHPDSGYFRRTLKPTIFGTDTVALNHVAWERDDFVILKLVVLHRLDERPRIVPIGKIVDAESPEVIDPSRRSQRRPFLAESLQGDPLIHLFRAVIYAAVAVTLVLVAIPLNTLRNRASRGLRRRKANHVYGAAEDEDLRRSLLIYAGYGRKALKELLDEPTVSPTVSRYRDEKEALSHAPVWIDWQPVTMNRTEQLYLSGDLKNVVERTESRLQLTQSFQDALKKALART